MTHPKYRLSSGKPTCKDDLKPLHCKSSLFSVSLIDFQGHNYSKSSHPQQSGPCGDMATFFIESLNRIFNQQP